MTKKFFAAMGMATAFLLTGAMTAQAADVTFGGQIRLRGESWSGVQAPGVTFGPQGLFLNDNYNTYIGQRIRLNANVKVDDDLSAFIQLQSATRWGLNGTTPPRGALIGLSEELVVADR